MLRPFSSVDSLHMQPAYERVRRYATCMQPAYYDRFAPTNNFSYIWRVTSFILYCIVSYRIAACIRREAPALDNQARNERTSMSCGQHCVICAFRASELCALMMSFDDLI